MQIHVKQGLIQEEDTELVVVNLFEGVSTPGGALKAVDQALNGLITQLIEEKDFRGRLGETHLIYSQGAMPAPRVLITGLGKAEIFDLDRARQAAAAAARRARKLGVSRYSTIVHGAGQGDLDYGRAAQAVVEGTFLGLYRFDGYDRDNKPEETGLGVSQVTVVEVDDSRLDSLRENASIGQVYGEATNWARDLANEPSNFLTPGELSRRVSERGQQAGLRVEVLGEAEMAEMGAGSFLGIAQGSDQEGQFIVLEHLPKGRNAGDLTTVVLVGKAITFDTGGISLKPKTNMWKMKNDMGGGGATAAALVATALLNLPIHAVGIIPATENMPSGRAIKPGDVLTAMNGKTVEIISTDAEGRQVLADALCYAQRFDPAAVVDIATLTGSIGIALGRKIAGLFCDNDELRGRLSDAGQLAGEPLWPMPIYKPYRKLIDSDVADMKNSGGAYGGAINAALFLKEFAEGYPWAHLDVAGASWQDEQGPYSVRGGTGYGTRLLIELLRGYGQE
ncbi:MAG: leucyl aminopeptidase [Chloroflexota bacterium]|nr:leucyl aminopeptidase [Chloroflexota bacterium]